MVEQHHIKNTSMASLYYLIFTFDLMLMNTLAKHWQYVLSTWFHSAGGL